MNFASHIVIGGRSLDARPETVFIGVVLISIGLRTFLQKSAWWYHLADRILDITIGVVAVTTIPKFGADVSKITTQSWAGYGVSVIIAVVTAIIVSPKGK